MKLKSLLLGLVETVMLVFYCLVVFIVTTILLSNKKNISSTITQPFLILEKDSCYMDYSNDLRNHIEGEQIVIYAETEPCAACAERSIMNVVFSILDSCSVKRPILVYHPTGKIDSEVIDVYHNKFDKYLRVFVTSEDSIMDKNSWMPKYLGFYGIVTDSLRRVLYAGSLFDDRFLECCYREFKIK